MRPAHVLPLSFYTVLNMPKRYRDLRKENAIEETAAQKKHIDRQRHEKGRPHKSISSITTRGWPRTECSCTLREGFAQIPQ